MMTRRAFLSAAVAAAQSPRRPNVVLFLSDDMGWADLGCYGATDIRTPNIDRLAREGVKLTDCYSNGPVCTPTRCGLMTGRYQQRYGKGMEWALLPSDTGVGLPPRHTTIARLLKNAGYKTAIHGKWHLGREPEFNPIHHGFDEYFGLRGGNVDMYSKEDRFKNYDLYDGLQESRVPGYLTELIAARSVRFIEANKANPFFLYVPFNAVHWPFQGPDRPESVRDLKTWYVGSREGEYKAMLESMDAAVGKVLHALERQGVANNTLVIFTNDNGGERLSESGPFRNGKATLWEGGVRVPALLRWPGKLPKAKVSQQACMSMDLTATIASACSVSAGAGEPFDGIDLTPILSGRQAEKERDLFWRINRPGQRMIAVRSGKWKYVRDGSIHNLFDLSRDPGESNDLYYDYPELAAILGKKIDAWEESLKKS
ncbi:MAG: twin-arginine translocation pathway signal protein [Acidobacteria bacterium]|nr:twin-arginine translocation pathway signal protein [Acidobacteriota bacterium]